eukprot:CAMPEP_0180276282 /NCGR_PEP_ID=MMETSP0988-20121125/6278_1 /TAXON_ID=697907 /ORGANISM="non described non described, Strain CCMP2293" /LENGTH=83 /DNA_ID=CAMNT_0022247575 /DNA_START=82 /DNA_END=329 /DNA_ORIENTATION=+
MMVRNVAPCTSSTLQTPNTTHMITWCRCRPVSTSRESAPVRMRLRTAAAREAALSVIPCAPNALQSVISTSWACWHTRFPRHA